MESTTSSVSPRLGSGWKSRVPVFAAALWWGSLTTTGFLVVPALFMQLPTSAMAGQMAAKLFSIQTWVALGCGMFLMLASRSGNEGEGLGWARGALSFITAGVLLALLIEFAVAPRIVARENLMLWHNLGSGMYIAQWLCAGVTLWKVSNPLPPPSGA